MARKTKMNSLTSPALIKKICPENSRLLNEFMDYLKSIKRSKQTCIQYKYDLQIFFCWIEQYANNKPFVKVTKRDIVSFQGWMINDNENSPARVRRVKAAISSLSNFVENVLDEEEEYKGFRSIVKKIENPTMAPVREKTVWKDEELEYLLDELSIQGKHEMACCVALAMFGGRRKSELTRFMVSDFDDDKIVCDGALYKSQPLLTKGNKYLECYTLTKKFRPYFENWMEIRNAYGIESPWLFPKADDPTKPVTISTLNSWAEICSRITGRDFYFHSLRHYYCSALIRAGIPDSVVIDIIGWESADMLKIYDDNPKDEKLSMYFKDGDISVPEKKGLSDL